MTKTELNAYNLVRRGIARTRAELSKTMDISRPTASAVADSLIAGGYLRDGGKWRSNGGRNPILLMVCPEAFSLIGVDLSQPDRVTGVLVSAAGDVVRRCEFMMPPDTPDRAAEAVSLLWERLDPESSACGIGLAIPGASGSGAPTRLNAETLVGTLRKRFIGKYFYLGNCDRLAAESEGFSGAADREENYMWLALNRKLACTLVIDGKCFGGAHGNAGNLNGIMLPPADGGPGATLGGALAEYAPSEAAAPEALATLCADGLRQAIDILDVGLIVLSGRFLDFSADFMPLLERRIAGLGCRVKASAFGAFAAARGAALHAHMWG